MMAAQPDPFTLAAGESSSAIARNSYPAALHHRCSLINAANLSFSGRNRRFPLARQSLRVCGLNVACQPY